MIGCLFSVKREERIEKEFDKVLLRVGDKKEEIINGLKSCTKEEKIVVKYLYGTMPISDIVDYDFDIFLDYAKHGIYLWKEGIYKDGITEDIFLNYVMHHRVNNEDIIPCRRFFYDKIKGLLENKSMKEAIIEINYWCSSEATYQNTDDRTISPMGVFKSAFGRCGEESTFAVTALRSVGIPARQVYVPRWSHCDDNHAWVEVLCDGQWCFFGACEAEEVLNRGWFTSASSRAMIIHSKWFDYVKPKEEVIGKDGMATVINNLNLYANTTKLNIIVTDDNGCGTCGALVDLEVLNYSEYSKIATLITDKDGKVAITIGLGDIHIHARKNGIFAEKIINTNDLKGEIVKLQLKKDIAYEMD